MQTNPVTKNLTVVQKTTKNYVLYFKQDGSAIDITGWTVYFTIKTKLSDTDANAIIKKTVTSHSYPLQGETLVALTATDTNQTPGSYYYECRFKTDDLDEGVIMNGRFIIEKTLTQST